MRSVLREEAVRLRIEEQKSFTAIRHCLGIPKGTLSYWLKDIPFSPELLSKIRREAWSKSESSREKYRETMRLKRQAKETDQFERAKTSIGKLTTRDVYLNGLMLYVAEGAKKERYSVSLANTDPSLHRFYINWLEVCFGIPRSKLKVQLRLYEGMNISNEEAYWRKELSFTKSQFNKTQVRELKPGSFTYRSSFGHGTCQISYYSVEVKTEIMAGIRALLDRSSYLG